MNRIIKFILIVLMLIFWQGMNAQNLPNTGMFYSNPYFYNPAFVAANSMLEINANYRMQWVEVNNAPKILNANVQYASKANMRFGLSLYSEENVGLKTNTFYFTTAYRVNFNTENHLTFGLSVGAIQNTLDQKTLSEYPEILEDPAIRNAVNNTYYFSSQLGVKYQLKKLTIGLALPKLLENKAYSEDDFNKPSFDQLNQFISSLSYKASINEKIQFQPLALLRYEDKNSYQAEINGLFSYNEMIWLGAGYRHQAGIIGHIGLQLKNNLSFSYAYEDAGLQASTFGGATHEINVKFRLKRKNKEEKQKEIKENIIAEETIKTDTASQAKEKVIEVEPEAQQTDSLFAVDMEEPLEATNEIDSLKTESDEAQKVTGSTGLAPGYYVVVGVFSAKENAVKYVQRIQDKGFEAEAYYNSEKDYYYVSLIKTDDLKKATEKRNYVRQLRILNFSDAWLMEITD